MHFIYIQDRIGLMNALIACNPLSGRLQYSPNGGDIHITASATKRIE